MTFLQVHIVFYALLFFIIFLFEFKQVSTFQCKGESNQNVDWFLLYKIPKISKSDNSLIKEGVAYLYMDSESFKNGWTLSKKNISSKNSVPAYTLAPIYNDEIAQKLYWVLYSDQPPNKPTKFTYGHAKGAVIANKDEGFWLIHSVPHFPPEPNTGKDPKESLRSKNNKNVDKTEDNVDLKDIPKGEYAYPNSGRVNGQSFLCISFNITNLSSITTQLTYNEIIPYRQNIVQNSIDKYTFLADGAKQVKIKEEPYNNEIKLYSTKGMEFTSFAKSSKWNKDLYDDFVAPKLDTDLYTETWLNGRDKLPSECNQSRVLNIQSVSLPKANVHFKSSRDHSKWAVSINEKKTASWVCVGDINRAGTQFDRGGGTVCLNVYEVWKNYRDVVDDVEPCPKPNPKGFFDRIKSWFG